MKARRLGVEGPRTVLVFLLCLGLANSGPLRAHPSENQTHCSEPEQPDPKVATRRARLLDQPLAQRAADQLLERTHAPPVEPEEQRDEREHGPEPVHELRLREAELAHGSLRNTVPVRREERTISESADQTNIA